MTAPTSENRGSYTGSRVPRVEDQRLLTGEGTFVDDVVRPGMLHARFVRSPFARAQIGDIDTSAALALEGVHAVFVASDLNPGVHEAWHTVVGGKHVPDTPRPPLAEGEARFVGDPVALVLARSPYLAEDAAELVMVDYTPLDPVVDYTQAQAADSLVHEAYAHNLAGGLGAGPSEAVQAAYARAAHVVTETLHQQAYAAVPMETRGLVAEWSSGEFTVWAASQSPHELRAFTARLLGLPEHAVRVIMRDTGGGFGQKTVPLREDMCILLAARRVPHPIKWIEDRRENLMAAGQGRQSHGEATLAFDETGLLLAAHLDHVQNVGAYPTPWPVATQAAVGLIFPGPYRVGAASWSTKSVFSNTTALTAYRGPWQFESYAREVLLDIAARRMQLDPAELRRRNMLTKDEFPYTSPTGFVYSQMSPLECFDEALRIIDYDAFRREQAVARAEGRFLGIGTGSYVEPTSSNNGHYATEGATIRIEPSGIVNVYVAGGSSGNSTETAAVQIAADALGCPIESVHTIQGDTAVTPYGGGAAGSRSGSMIAGAVGETAALLRDRIQKIAAHRLETQPEAIVLENGYAGLPGDAERRISLAELAEMAYFRPHELPEGVPPGLEASGRYRAEAMAIWANATHAVTVEVDPTTGRVEILRYVVAEDCGPMIHPAIVAGQIDGGSVQGIGGVLYEHMAYDDDGNPITTTFLDYLLPTMPEVPEIEHGHVTTMGPGAGGHKGVGEGGAIGSVPAIVNAVADALVPFDVEVTRLPITPSSLLALIDGRKPRGPEASS